MRVELIDYWGTPVVERKVTYAYCGGALITKKVRPELDSTMSQS